MSARVKYYWTLSTSLWDACWPAMGCLHWPCIWAPPPGVWWTNCGPKPWWDIIPGMWDTPPCCKDTELQNQAFTVKQLIQTAVWCTLTGCCWLRRRLRSCGLAPGFVRRRMGPWGGACPLVGTWLGGAPLTGGCWLVGPAALIVIWRNATQFRS